jgi:hypothetical protein
VSVVGGGGGWGGEDNLGYVRNGEKGWQGRLWRAQERVVQTVDLDA